MRNLKLMLLLLLGLPLTALAQTTTLQSRIIDLSGNGIPGVEITETATCATFSGTASSTTTKFTDANGSFNWPSPNLPGGGSQCAVTVEYTFAIKKEGYFFTRSTFIYRPPPGLPFGSPPVDQRLPLIHGTTLPPWTSVSAASFNLDRVVTSEMITAAFGVNLAATTETATSSPLPTALAGRRVIVLDSQGVERAAPLLFVSPAQVNYVTPPDLAAGSAAIKLVDENNNVIKAGFVEIRKIAPAIFTANADGRGVPAAVILHVRPDGEWNYELVAQFDEAQKRFVPAPLDLGPESEFVVLALFGTGWRQVTDVSQVNVSIGTPGAQVSGSIEYVGKQPTFEGLDQINVRLPRTLIGRGEVSVSVFINYVGANVVQLKFQ